MRATILVVTEELITVLDHVGQVELSISTGNLFDVVCVVGGEGLITIDDDNNEYYFLADS